MLIHRRLRHENIIKFYDVFEEKKKVYIVLEYAKHGNLFYYLHKYKRFSEIEAFKFFFQTLKAIKYMHDRNLVHRDLKVLSTSETLTDSLTLLARKSSAGLEPRYQALRFWMVNTES